MSPDFVGGQAGKAFCPQVQAPIHLVDSTTIPLIASCMDWAKHRRRKAAAKCHLRLDLQSFLPRFAIVDTARHNDAKRAREVCAGIKAGEIVIFDKAYVDFDHLADLSMREVFWVTRAKDNMQFKVVPALPAGGGRQNSARRFDPAADPGFPRRIIRNCCAGSWRWWRWTAQEVEMVFLTNNLEWSARQHRRVISLPLADRSVLQADQADAPVGGLSGHQRQRRAVAGVDGLAGLSACCGIWRSCPNGVIASAGSLPWCAWRYGKNGMLLHLLRRYGTAEGHFRYLARPEQAYLPGLG